MRDDTVMVVVHTMNSEFAFECTRIEAQAMDIELTNYVTPEVLKIRGVKSTYWFTVENFEAVELRELNGRV